MSQKNDKNDASLRFKTLRLAWPSHKIKEDGASQPSC